MRVACAFVLVVTLGGPPGWRGATETVAGSATPFVLDDEGGVILPVVLNGRGPFRFLLDTGSTHSALSEETAAATGAPVVASAVVGSSVGEQSRPVVRMERFELGPLVLTDLVPSVVDLRGVDPDGGIDGLIGQDALARLRYTIDFRHRRILWWPDEATLEGGAALTLEPSQGRFLVLLPQQASVVRLVPDSGAGTIVLFERSLHRLPRVTLLPDMGILASMTARRTVRRATLIELRVGPLSLRHVPAVVLSEQTGSDPMEGDGLLPLHLFERVTFDAPRRALILE